MTTVAQRTARTFPSRIAGVASAVLLALVAGCATAPDSDRHTAGAKDPLEPFNRKMFAFNDKLDTYALKPVATAYKNVVPTPVQTGVHNFFGNFSDAWSAVNQLLQGKPRDAATMTARFVTNTVVGFGGLFDPASRLGLERKSEDLGQTFGRWGAPPGAYLVLPLFGSSDIRDAIALPADDYVTPALLVPSTWQKVGVDAVGVVDQRAGLLGASQMLDELAFDRYTFMRDAYVTRRRSLVYDGNPPELPDATDDDGDKSAPTLAPAAAGAASGAQGGLKPVLPAAPAPGAKSSSSSNTPRIVGAAPVTRRDTRVAMLAPSPYDAASPAAPVPVLPPSGPSSVPPAVPGTIMPAPLAASSPTLPVPLPGPAPVPPPPRSAQQV